MLPLKYAMKITNTVVHYELCQWTGMGLFRLKKGSCIYRFYTGINKNLGNICMAGKVQAFLK